MRAVILVAAAALGLAACGKNDQAENTTNVDETLTADNIVSNDVTAIDAVTGDAANMAADVNFINEGDSNAGAPSNSGSSSRQRSRTRIRPRQPRSAGDACHRPTTTATNTHRLVSR